VATSRERMAATTARPRAGLVQFVATMPTSDRDEIARAGYEAIAGKDERAAAEALRLRCLPRRPKVTAQRNGVFARCCGVTRRRGSSAAPAWAPPAARAHGIAPSACS
jgi:hypothetical protein